MANFKVVIPARFGSQRLPGKPLLEIAGKPMIAHVCERALEASADEVVVATDDDRICRVAEASGARAVMTSESHSSGTERIAEAARICGWTDSDIIVNLQGDEPLLSPGLLQLAADSLAAQQTADVATLAAPIRENREIFSPHAVKVVVDHEGFALYFSRAPIPWDREHFTAEGATITPRNMYFRHIGLYAYTVGFLERYVEWPKSPLEACESLEQLRILWRGERIFVAKVMTIPEAGVDTEDDRRRVEGVLESR